MAGICDRGAECHSFSIWSPISRAAVAVGKNQVQTKLYIFLRGARTQPTRLVCVRHCLLMCPNFFAAFSSTELDVLHTRWTVLSEYTFSSRIVCMLRSCLRGSIFIDPVKPNPPNNWTDPTQTTVKRTDNSGQWWGKMSDQFVRIPCYIGKKLYTGCRCQ